MPSKMVSIKTVTITTLDWWLHYEFGNVGLFRHQQQSWTKRKLLLINGRIGCVFGAKLCFHITFLRSRFGDPRWNRAKKKGQIYLQHWWTTFGFQQLLLKDLWQWIIPNLYQTLSCQSVFVDTDWCLITFALLYLILLSYHNHKQRRNGRNFHIFCGCSNVSLVIHILFWKFVEIIIMCDWKSILGFITKMSH